MSPDGASVYLTNGGNDSVSQYDAGAGGALTPKSPPTVAAGANPIGVAVSPDGGSVYVANFIGGNFGGTVSQYDVGPGGALTPKSPPTVFADHDPSGVAARVQPRLRGRRTRAPMSPPSPPPRTPRS